MNIDYLIQLLTNRLNGLALAKDQAFQAGDLERINAVDAEILDVQNTLSKLKLISSIEQTAAATPFTEAEVVKNGIEASFNPTVINDATRCLLSYNIAPYATDPNHEASIQSILEKMPPISGPDQIDMYISSIVSNSPLTGQMFWNSANKYNVDVRLMMALVQQDSQFATLGIAVTTFNPGNVGNDGTNTHTYSSWDDGVDAVANWLNNHRINVAPVVAPPVTPPVVAPVTPPVDNTVTPPVTTPAPIVDTPPVVTPPADITPPPAADTTPPTVDTPPVVTPPPVDTTLPTNTTTTDPSNPVVSRTMRKTKRSLS